MVKDHGNKRKRILLSQTTKQVCPHMMLLWRGRSEIRGAENFGQKLKFVRAWDVLHERNEDNR